MSCSIYFYGDFAGEMGSISTSTIWLFLILGFRLMSLLRALSLSSLGRWIFTFICSTPASFYFVWFRIELGFLRWPDCFVGTCFMRPELMPEYIVLICWWVSTGVKVMTELRLLFSNLSTLFLDDWACNLLLKMVELCWVICGIGFLKDSIEDYET